MTDRLTLARALEEGGARRDEWFLAAVLAAGFFYWLRCRHRLLYGASEVAVGLAILALLFLTTPPSALLVSSSSPWFGGLTTIIGPFTGIYAIVRGLDNIRGRVR